MRFVHRLALALGCTVNELLRRLTLDELFAWRAYEELDPWGETRADFRQAAATAYHLSPYLPVGFELPKLTYPYFAAAEDVDVAAIEAAAKAAEQHWQEWDRQRRASFSRDPTGSVPSSPTQERPATDGQ